MRTLWRALLMALAMPALLVVGGGGAAGAAGAGAAGAAGGDAGAAGAGGEGEGADDEEPGDDEAAPAAGETIPAEVHRKVVKESRARKLEIRNLRARLAQLESGATPTDRERGLVEERDALKTRLHAAELRGTLAGLTDGGEVKLKDGTTSNRPRRVSDRVLDIMAADAAAQGLEGDDLADFVAEFQSENAGLFLAAAPASAAATVTGPASVRRAATPAQMDPTVELATWHKLTPAERKEAERAKPGTSARMHRLSVEQVVAGLRGGVEVEE